jgi:hypothetical protein
MRTSAEISEQDQKPVVLKPGAQKNGGGAIAAAAI